MALILTATQKCALAISVVDAKGNKAQVEGAPQWSSAEPGVVSVEAAADGLSATIRAVGPTTETPVQVSVTADADLGDGVTPIVGTLEVSVVAGAAVAVAISPGTPEEDV